MVVSWLFLCLFDFVFFWFYLIYFVILLVYWEWCDYYFCSTKYGVDWECYCEKVFWCIIFYVY